MERRVRRVVLVWTSILMLGGGHNGADITDQVIDSFRGKRSPASKLS
jgi:hypothetical protein